MSLWEQDSGHGACFPWAGQPPLPVLALPHVLPLPRGCIMAREPPSGSGQLFGTPADPQPGWRGWWLSGSSQLSSLALWLEGGRAWPLVPTQPLPSTPEELQPEWPATDLPQVAGAWALPHGPGVRSRRPSPQHGSPARHAVPTAIRLQGLLRGGQPQAPACTTSARAGRQPHCGKRHALLEEKRGQGARLPHHLSRRLFQASGSQGQILTAGLGNDALPLPRGPRACSWWGLPPRGRQAHHKARTRRASVNGGGEKLRGSRPEAMGALHCGWELLPRAGPRPVIALHVGQELLPQTGPRPAGSCCPRTGPRLWAPCTAAGSCWPGQPEPLAPLCVAGPWEGEMR